VKSVLPLLEERTAAARSTEVRAGLAPIGSGPVRKGARLVVLAWICPGRDSPGPPAVLRFVSRDDNPLFRFDTEPRRSDGPCFEVEDRVETSALEAGPHAYRVRCSPSPDAEPVEQALVWELRDGTAPGP
jgi:hypothetical protein